MTRDASNWLDISLSRAVSGDISAVHKFGRNAVVGTTEEDIWTPGGLYPWPTAAETVRVKAGGNVNDIAAGPGSGAHKIIVQGLDENWAVQSEEITLAGASASAATTVTFIRVFRAYVSEAGTYGGNNTGIVQVENTSSTNVLAELDALTGQTEMCIYTVPASFDAYLLAVFADVESTKPTTVKFWQRQNADDTSTPFSAKRLIDRIEGLDGQAQQYFPIPLHFPAKTDIWASGVVAATSAAIDVEMSIALLAV